ncbi:hypothetical protein CHCC20441_4190 [Bacillus licheniformis]|nr:hypothetical protein B4090_2389 [Bacillus licheniformis]TWN16513.1 hypothetical protein CHCC14564_1078 [Bacillus licheniformis LMG 17339]KYC83876.1 hypothetical protein B4091_2455 [Bacillus licheniformis]OLF95300.1 hypothetical protein B4094_1346 [Bacillus licheniformis]OLF96852.1 hypothetical protein B4089_0453 [Bacillus licheniformis]
MTLIGYCLSRFFIFNPKKGHRMGDTPIPELNDDKIVSLTREAVRLRNFSMLSPFLF